MQCFPKRKTLGLKEKLSQKGYFSWGIYVDATSIRTFETFTQSNTLQEIITDETREENHLEAIPDIPVSQVDIKPPLPSRPNHNNEKPQLPQAPRPAPPMCKENKTEA
ncbi:hypothetical protein RMATCC62417_10573 [Rhizopus microsporus]|nr:hypothetical protein RMATCC62417_10573 [Rhizopus microsporus]